MAPGQSRRARFPRAVPLAAIAVVLGVVLVGILYAWTSRLSSSPSPPSGPCAGYNPGNVGTPEAQPDLSVGSEVADAAFTELAGLYFQENVSCLVVSVALGSQGQVVSALCADDLNIAAIAGPVPGSGVLSIGCGPTVTVTRIAADAVVPLTAESNPVVAFLNGLTANRSFLTSGVSLVEVGNGSIAWSSNLTGERLTEPLFSFNRTTLTAIYAGTSTRPEGNNLTESLAAYSIAKSAPFVGNVTSSCSHGMTSCLRWGQIPFPAGCGTVVSGVAQPGCIRDPAATAVIDAYDRIDPASSEFGLVSSLLDLPNCGPREILVACGVHLLPVASSEAMLNATAGDSDSLGFGDLRAISTTSELLSPAGFAGANQTRAVPADTGTADASVSANATNGSDGEAYAGSFAMEYLTKGTPVGFELEFLELVENGTTDRTLCNSTGLLPPSA